MPPWLIVLGLAAGVGLIWKALTTEKNNQTPTAKPNSQKTQKRRNNVKTPNIFISHRREYDEDYYSLIKKLDEKKYYHADYSVPTHDRFDLKRVEEIEKALEEQVRQCNFFIIFANMAMNNSDWVKKEVKYAKDYGKHILAVKPWNYQGNIPQFIQEAQHDTVGFDSSAIIRRIEEKLNKE